MGTVDFGPEQQKTATDRWANLRSMVSTQKGRSTLGQAVASEAAESNREPSKSSRKLGSQAIGSSIIDKVRGSRKPQSTGSGRKSQAGRVAGLVEDNLILRHIYSLAREFLDDMYYPPPLLVDNRLYHKLAIARAGTICE